MSASATVRVRGDRLVWYRDAADEPGHWERHWREHPPVNIPNLTLPAWYRGLMFRWLPRDGLICEAGCGHGVVKRALRDKGFEVEGVDFAEETVAANRRVDPSGRYRVADVRGLPYGDGELAGYISLGVIEHFEDDGERGRIVSEAWRCLRRGGVAVISTPYYSPLRRLAGGFNADGSGGEGGAGAFYQFAFSMSELVGEVEAGGLRVVHRDAYGVRKGFKDTVRRPGVTRAIFGASEDSRRWADHPVRPVRLLAGHMAIVVAVKP